MEMEMETEWQIPFRGRESEERKKKTITITYLIPDDRYNCIIHHDLLPAIRSMCISIANQSPQPVSPFSLSHLAQTPRHTQ